VHPKVSYYLRSSHACAIKNLAVRVQANAQRGVSFLLFFWFIWAKSESLKARKPESPSRTGSRADDSWRNFTGTYPSSVTGWHGRFFPILIIVLDATFFEQPLQLTPRWLW